MVALQVLHVDCECAHWRATSCFWASLGPLPSQGLLLGGRLQLSPTPSPFLFQTESKQPDSSTYTCSNILTGRAEPQTLNTVTEASPEHWAPLPPRPPFLERGRDGTIQRRSCNEFWGYRSRPGPHAGSLPKQSPSPWHARWALPTKGLNAGNSLPEQQGAGQGAPHSNLKPAVSHLRAAVPAEVDQLGTWAPEGDSASGLPPSHYG